MYMKYVKCTQIIEYNLSITLRSKYLLRAAHETVNLFDVHYYHRTLSEHFANIFL